MREKMPSRYTGGAAPSGIIIVEPEISSPAQLYKLHLYSAHRPSRATGLAAIQQAGSPVGRRCALARGRETPHER